MNVSMSHKKGKKKKSQHTQSIAEQQNIRGPVEFITFSDVLSAGCFPGQEKKGD